MENESISMLTWAFEYPYLYFGVKMKPAIIAVACAAVIKAITIVALRVALKK